MRELAQEVVARCRLLAQFTEEPGRITRTFLSEPMHGVHQIVGEWMRSAGLTVRIDSVGNIRGVTEGSFRLQRRFLLASHLDTVPNAGAFDGILGVVLAITLVARRSNPLPFPMEVIGFSEEEGVRFRLPFIGSRAVMGTLDEGVLQATDANGTSVREAIRSFGLGCLPHSPLQDEALNALGYLEFHIEQGPVLDKENLPLGVVQAIAGQSRWELCFEGRANHAGTTPMAYRQDAIAAAAEWILEVERSALARQGLVATNGFIAVDPNAINVVPGTVRVSLDIRHAQDAIRLSSASQLIGAAETIGARRKIRVRSEAHLNQAAVAMDHDLSALLARAVSRAGYPVRRMVSGAGHDAMIFAPKVPSAMLFLRSPGGISHHPDEDVRVDDVEAALRAGAGLLEELEAQYA